jgi:hypothetical protein
VHKIIGSVHDGYPLHAPDCAEIINQLRRLFKDRDALRAELAAAQARVAELQGEYARGVNDALQECRIATTAIECRLAIRALLPAGKGVV